MVKNLPANARDIGGISREDPLEEGMATPCSILVWEISWTEEPGGLWGHKELDITDHARMVSCVFELKCCSN